MSDHHSNDLPPSKSQRKRDARALFDLGRELAELSPSQLESLDLPERIRSAVDEARNIRQHVARKRQLQFLAKQLRHIDADPIQEALDALHHRGREETARLHRLEAWRDRLLADGDAAVTELLDLRHDVDVQHLRQLLRKARQQAGRNVPPSAARELFRLLRSLDEEQPLPATLRE